MTSYQFMVSDDRSKLLPANPYARWALQELIPGSAITIDIETSQRRELRKHVFHVLSRIANAMGMDSEWLRVMLLIKTGRAHRITVNGEEIAVVNSMARQFMDQEELRAFWHDMRHVVLDQILPELSEIDRAEILPLLDGQ
jgi:hypothetical protein